MLFSRLVGFELHKTVHLIITAVPVVLLHMVPNSDSTVKALGVLVILIQRYDLDVIFVLLVYTYHINRTYYILDIVDIDIDGQDSIDGNHHNTMVLLSWLNGFENWKVI
jgi:hypothetical protein